MLKPRELKEEKFLKAKLTCVHLPILTQTLESLKVNIRS